VGGTGRQARLYAIVETSAYSPTKIMGFVCLDYIGYLQSRVTQARSILALLIS